MISLLLSSRVIDICIDRMFDGISMNFLNRGRVWVYLRHIGMGHWMIYVGNISTSPSIYVVDAIDVIIHRANKYTSYDGKLTLRSSRTCLTYTVDAVGICDYLFECDYVDVETIARRAIERGVRC